MPDTASQLSRQAQVFSLLGKPTSYEIHSNYELGPPNNKTNIKDQLVRVKGLLNINSCILDDETGLFPDFRNVVS